MSSVSPVASMVRTPKDAIGALEVSPLVGDKGLQRQQENRTFTIEHVPERREFANHRLARRGRGGDDKMLAIQHAEVVDGRDLQGVEGWDWRCPGADKSWRKADRLQRANVA